MAMITTSRPTYPFTDMFKLLFALPFTAAVVADAGVPLWLPPPPIAVVDVFFPIFEVVDRTALPLVGALDDITPDTGALDAGAEEAGVEEAGAEEATALDPTALGFQVVILALALVAPFLCKLHVITAPLTGVVMPPGLSDRGSVPFGGRFAEVKK